MNPFYWIPVILMMRKRKKSAGDEFWDEVIERTLSDRWFLPVLLWIQLAGLAAIIASQWYICHIHHVSLIQVLLSPFHLSG
jgi:hypothetical protein